MQLFLMGIFTRLLVAFGIAYSLLGCMVALNWGDYEAKWKEDIQLTERNIKLKPIICERIDNGELPLPTIHCDGRTYSNPYEGIIEEDICNKTKRGDKASLRKNYRCDETAVYDKQTLSSFVCEQYLKELMGKTLIIAAIIFFVLTLIKQYIAEPSQGWKRTSLVTAMLVAIIMGWDFYNGSSYSDNLSEGFRGFLIVFPCTLLVLLNGKLVVLWVKAGYNADRGNVIVASNPETPLQSLEPTMPVHVVKAFPASTIDTVKPVEWVIPTFWVRLWARGIDISVVILLSALITALLPDLEPFSTETTNGVLLNVGIGLVELCLVMLGYEYIFLRLFGATPGKMIFSLKVFDYNDSIINGKDVINRTHSFIRNGLGYMLWFPWLQGFMAFNTYKYLDTNQITKWDLGIYRVKQKPIHVVRWLIGTIMSIVLLSSAVAITQFAKQLAKKQNLEATFHK